MQNQLLNISLKYNFYYKFETNVCLNVVYILNRIILSSHLREADGKANSD